MLISASRRTNIPAFYSQWFINRVRAGYAAVPNPYYPEKISRVSLRPKDVDVIAFSTRNPRPLFPYLGELDGRGFQYYFLITILGNPHDLDPKSPSLKAALPNFLALTRRLGPERVIWRYDPILLSDQTGPDYHIAQFHTIAAALRGATNRVIISYLDDYAKARPRLSTLPARGFHLDPESRVGEQIPALTTALAQIAAEMDMRITSCTETYDLEPYGVQPGKCLDDDLVWSAVCLAARWFTRKTRPSARFAAAPKAVISACMIPAASAACIVTPPAISPFLLAITAPITLTPLHFLVGSTYPATTRDPQLAASFI